MGEEKQEKEKKKKRRMRRKKKKQDLPKNKENYCTMIKGLYEFARAAITEYHKFNDLGNKD